MASNDASSLQGGKHEDLNQLVEGVKTELIIGNIMNGDQAYYLSSFNDAWCKGEFIVASSSNLE
jgi:hypothetical protein